MDRDRNLLFGVSAVQFDQIVPKAFVRAARKWAADQSREISEYLVEDGLLTEHDCEFIQWTVDRAIEASGGDTAAALEHLGGAEALDSASAGLIKMTDDGGIRVAAQDPQPVELAPPSPVKHSDGWPERPERPRYKHADTGSDESSDPEPKSGIGITLVGIGFVLLAGAGFFAWRVNTLSRTPDTADVASPPIGENQEESALFEAELARETEARRALRAEQDRKRALAETLQAHRRSLFLVQNRLNAEPDNVSLKFSLADIHASIAGVQARRGDYRAALDSDNDWVETLLDLQASVPEDRSVVVSLANAYRVTGNHHADNDNFEDAREAYRQSIAVCEDRQEAFEPDLAQACWQTYIDLAALSKREGDDGRAVDELRIAVEIARELVDADPERVDFRVHLAESYAAFGAAYADLGYDEPAVDALEQAYRVYEAALRIQPDVEDLLEEISVIYGRLIALYTRMEDQVMVSGLRATYMNLRQAIADARPEEVGVQRDLMHLYTAMGITYKKEGNDQGAMAAFESSLAIADRLLEHNPDDRLLVQEKERLERRLERLTEE